MRRIVFGFMSTVSALVLLFSYHTSLGASSSSASQEPISSELPTPAMTTSTGPPTPTDASPTPSASASTSTASSSTAAASTGSMSSSGTYTGTAADTRWGVVQVRITVNSGKITASQAVQYPTENGRDQEINAYAVPQLNSEVVSQQSGSIDAVSGATVTSDGYIQSLQSAIDQANL